MVLPVAFFHRAQVFGRFHQGGNYRGPLSGGKGVRRLAQGRDVRSCLYAPALPASESRIRKEPGERLRYSAEGMHKFGPRAVQ